MTAQEYSRWSDIVAQSLEAHIRRVSNPAFCLSPVCHSISCWLFLCYACHVPTYSLPYLSNHRTRKKGVLEPAPASRLRASCQRRQDICPFLSTSLASFHVMLTHHLPFLVGRTQVPPWMKLPAFYVLDAISKNVYEPYARTFAPFVAPLFLEAYAQVDTNTRSKMEEMLLTWRTGASNQKELFGVAAQISIERGIWGTQDQHQVRPTAVSSSSIIPIKFVQTPAGRGPAAQNPLSKNQVLSELDFTLGQKERALQANPYDSLAQGHINALQQVRRHCSTICG